MSYFDPHLAIGPVRPVDQYKPICQWSSLIGSHYLEARQIIHREAPWTRIYLMPTDTSVVRSNYRSYMPQNSNQCCKTSPLSTPVCFGLDPKDLLRASKFEQVTIIYDTTTGLVVQVPVTN